MKKTVLHKLFDYFSGRRFVTKGLIKAPPILVEYKPPPERRLTPEEKARRRKQRKHEKQWQLHLERKAAEEARIAAKRKQIADWLNRIGMGHINPDDKVTVDQVRAIQTAAKKALQQEKREARSKPVKKSAQQRLSDVYGAMRDKNYLKW